LGKEFSLDQSPSTGPVLVRRWMHLSPRGPIERVRVERRSSHDTKW
jgi:hypothetical protein